MHGCLVSLSTGATVLAHAAGWCHRHRSRTGYIGGYAVLCPQPPGVFPAVELVREGADAPADRAAPDAAADQP